MIGVKEQRGFCRCCSSIAEDGVSRTAACAIVFSALLRTHQKPWEFQLYRTPLVALSFIEYTNLIYTAVNMLAMQHTRLPSRPAGTRRDGGRARLGPSGSLSARGLLTASVAAAERLHRWHRRLDLRLARRVSCDAGESRACRRDCCSARSSTSTSSIAVDWRRCAAARCRVGASRGRVARPTNSVPGSSRTRMPMSPNPAGSWPRGELVPACQPRGSVPPRTCGDGDRHGAALPELR